MIAYALIGLGSVGLFIVTLHGNWSYLSLENMTQFGLALNLLIYLTGFGKILKASRSNDLDQYAFFIEAAKYNTPLMILACIAEFIHKDWGAFGFVIPLCTIVTALVNQHWNLKK